MKVIKDICYSDDASRDRVCDIYLPESEKFSVFIYFHGGGLEKGDKTSAEACAKYLAKRNVAVVSANYRLYPMAAFPDFVKDAACAVAWVHENIAEYGSCSGIYIGGSSAGAYLSMLLCLDKKYLAPYGLIPTQFCGFIHDAGQPTTHFNVLRERGFDERRVIIDEAAPLYHVGTEKKYAPMLFVVSDDDMQNRYEQTMLMLSTLKHFECSSVKIKVMHGAHCEYVRKLDENGKSVFGQIIYEFINEKQN